MKFKNTINLSIIKSEVSEDLVFITDFLQSFKENIKEYYRITSECLLNKNITGIREQAHKIAPSCEMLGLSDLYYLLKKIEIKCDKNIRIEQIETEVKQSVKQIEIVVQQIEKIILEK